MSLTVMRLSQLIGVTFCLLATTYADSYADYGKSSEQSQEDGTEDTSGTRIKYMSISDDVTGPITCPSADLKQYEDEQEWNVKVLDGMQQTADLSLQMKSRLLKIKERHQSQTTTMDLIVRILKNDVDNKTLTLPRKTIDKVVSALPQSVQDKVKRVVDNVGSDHALVSDEVSSVEIAELFLKTGARLDAQDIFSRSPLLVAAEHGHLSVVKWLINEHHADVKYRDLLGRIVLHRAIYSGKLDLVWWLLNNTDVDVEARDNDGETSLHYATQHLPLLQYLVTQAKADVTVTDAKGCTVLCWAARFCSLQSVKWLVQELHLDVNARDYGGDSILHHATIQVNKVKYLVQAGADVNIKNNKQQTVLHKAAALWGRFDTVQWLLSHTDLNVDSQDEDGNTALHFATSDLATVKVLVQGGADVNIKNNKQQSVLHKAAAAYYDYTATVQWLLGNTVINVDSQDEDGNTALHLATHDLATVKILLESGKADILLKNNQGQNVLDKARTDLKLPDNWWLLKKIKAVIDYLTNNTNLG